LTKEDKKARSEAWQAEGIRICIELIQQLRQIDGVAGVHIMAIEWEEAVKPIVEGAGLYLARLSKPSRSPLPSRRLPMSESTPTQSYQINSKLAQRIQEELGVNVYLCYQCVKCTSGCPVGEYFDWQPNQIMRAVQLGQEDIALDSQTPWLCASCQTCTTRCPQGLDITAIMEFLTREALKTGHKPQVPEVNVFNQAFMREVRLWGHAYELGLMAEIKLRNHDLSSDMDLAVKFLQKNKLPFLPLPPPAPQGQAHPRSSCAVAYYPAAPCIPLPVSLTSRLKRCAIAWGWS